MRLEKYHIRKIKAFTLLEIIIAMILSFFIIGMLYMSYQLIENQIRNEYQNNRSSLILLKNRLELDFFNADSLVFNQTVLHIYRHGNHSNYQFQEDCIIHEIDMYKDTLFHGTTTLNGQTILNKNWLSLLNLTLQMKDELIKMSFMKHYWPNQLLRGKEVRFEH